MLLAAAHAACEPLTFVVVLPGWLDSEGYRALDLSRGRLETIRGSFDGVSEVEVTTADIPALKASVSVSPTCAS